MTRVFLLLAAVGVVAGCSQSEADNNGSKTLTKPAKEVLAGTWTTTLELDDAKIAETLKRKGTPQGDLENAVASTKKMLAQQLGKLEVTLIVDSDGNVTTHSPGPRGRAKVEKATWEVASDDGKIVKLKTTEGSETANVVLTFRSDNEFEFTSDAAKFKKGIFKLPLIFRRKQ